MDTVFLYQKDRLKRPLRLFNCQNILQGRHNFSKTGGQPKSLGGRTLKMIWFMTVFGVEYQKKWVNISKNWGGSCLPCHPPSDAPVLCSQYSHSKYFKCSFDSNVLTLDFLISVDPQISIDLGKIGKNNKRRPSNKHRPWKNLALTIILKYVTWQISSIH